MTTESENLALGYTHAFGSNWLNEVRFGYLNARGGQVSPNQGVNFAALSGLQGVTQDARDMGYPQVSFGGLFSAIGDPTVVRLTRQPQLRAVRQRDAGSRRITT